MEDSGPARISVIWSPEARADVRAIDRETVTLESRNGDVKMLRPPRTDFRLRCGDYHIFFDYKQEGVIEISGVLHRRQAYR